MKKIFFVLFVALAFKTNAQPFAAIHGDCEINGQREPIDIPSGNGSRVLFENEKVKLYVFAGPSENLAKDDNGINLFDVTIMANAKNGKGLGTTILRHLTASPKLKRELAIDLRNGTFVNCRF